MASLELGPLEMQVLGLVETQGPATVAAIQAELRKKGGDLAYTTVMTVLTRLVQKGVLRRQKEGRRYLYSVGRGTGALKRNLLSRVHQALFRGRRAEPIAALLDMGDLSTDELRELRNRIDDRLRERGR